MAINGYEGKTDEELILMLRGGDKGVSDYLCDKYKNLVKSKAKTMYILGAEPEDLIQEGMIGLFKAIRDYDSSREASFFTFAELCVVSQMYTAVQASNRKKHAPLNSYVSLYAGDGDEDEKNPLVEEYADTTTMDPEQMLIDKENVEQIEQYIETMLSPFERQVLDLHLTGMGYAQIAKVLGKEEKSTDNALQRIRTKLKNIIKQA